MLEFVQECTSVSELLPADVPALPFCFLSYKPSEQQTQAKARLIWGKRVLLLANPPNKCNQGQGVLFICVSGAAGCTDACPGEQVGSSMVV